MAIVASGQLTLVDLNDSKQLIMFIGSSQQRQVIFNPNASGASQYVPNYSTATNVLTPQLFIAGTSGDIAGSTSATRWYVQTNSTGAPRLITASGQDATDYTIGTGAPKTLTIKANVLASNNSMTYICEMDYLDTDTGFTITAKAEYEIVKVTNGSNGTNGANAIMGILSNDSHTVPTDSAGNNGNFAGAVSTLTIYEGATDVTASWTITQTKSNVTVTEATNSKTATVTAMTAGQDTGYVEFTATRAGYANVVKRFTLTKNKSGASGANATAYWLQSSQTVISKSAGGTYTPTTVTFSAKSQTGSANVANYTGVFTIEESTNGTTFTAKYTTANVATGEASTTYTPVANLKSIRVRLYQLGGTTVMLDEQVISVVTDGSNGANGQDAVVAVVWTPDGNTIKNATGTLKAHVDVYKGSANVTGTAWKWYSQDPSATIANGKGDADGGDGWMLMKDATSANGVTGYTTDTITIPASAIVNVESFKCVVTYNSVKYSDVTTVIDVSDPFMVTIVGINTFKNGVGFTDLTAKIFQAGVEIDPLNNQGYTYTWYLYDNNNVKMTTWNTTGSKTGKTIRVDGADVTVRGNIVCEVSK
uniref:Minor tail protein n=1 Tax=Bacillus phage KoopaTroopa TaxID=3234046 RepID=A0AB39C724_9CAUD